MNHLPVVDCHRHLSGSVSAECVWQMLLRTGVDVPLANIRREMTFADFEPPDFCTFLSKFNIFGEFVWDTNLIRMACQDICHALAAEKTDYALLDFSINKYVSSGWDAAEVVKLIHSYFEYYRPGGVGLVLSLTYESPKAKQEQYAALIANPEVAGCVVGIDLVGDESYFDYGFYKTILTPWRAADKMVRAHVGESQSADNIRHAIIDLEVTNVAHGIKLFDDPDLAPLALDHDIVFDMALSSNFLTGVWCDRTSHPFHRALKEGLCVTIGSDDPIVCETNIAKEYALATELGASPEESELLKANAVTSAKRWALPNSVLRK